MKTPTLLKLKTVRTTSGLSANVMAKNLNISKTMYIYIENGKRRLAYDMAIKIAEFFKMTPDELFLEDSRKFF